LYFQDEKPKGIADDDEKRLLTFLFANYDPELHPVLKKTDTVQVKFGISLHQIIEVDFKNQIVKSSVWIRQEWHNPYLIWNGSNYGGIDAINVDAKKVWKPDIFLYNNVDDSDDGALDRFKTKVQIKSSGTLMWMAPKIVSSSCKFDVTYFPFDRQVCRMKFGSWTYDGFRLDLIPEGHPEGCDGDIKKFIRHGEWDLISMPCSRNEVIYKCCPEPYPDITYTMDLRRRHMFYFVNMIAPCFLISALTLLSFYLPPESGERLTLVITNLLALTVFMLLVVEIIPATSETVPLISVYFYGSVFEVALALVATCLVLRCYFNNPSHTPVPNWVRHIVLGWMARLTKVPVKKILHGIDPKESSKKTPTTSTSTSTEENETPDPEPVVHKKIPNSSQNHLSSSQQLHVKPASLNVPGDIQPRLNLLPAIQRIRNSSHRLSMPPIYDNIHIGGAMNDLISGRTASRLNLSESASQHVIPNVKSTDDVTGTDHVTRTLLETQTALSKDVSEVVRYIQDQEMGDLMKEEWQLIAVIIDKFFLWMFLIILCVSTVVIFMQAPSYAWS